MINFFQIFQKCYEYFNAWKKLISDSIIPPLQELDWLVKSDAYYNKAKCHEFEELTGGLIKD